MELQKLKGTKNTIRQYKRDWTNTQVSNGHTKEKRPTQKKLDKQTRKQTNTQVSRDTTERRPTQNKLDKHIRNKTNTQVSRNTPKK